MKIAIWTLAAAALLTSGALVRASSDDESYEVTEMQTDNPGLTGAETDTGVSTSTAGESSDPYETQSSTITNQSETQAGDAGSTQATLTARLVNEEEMGRQRAASVQVTVEGVTLVEATATTSATGSGEGHLHYQLDDQAAVDTSSPTLTFYDLTPGDHTLRVTLVSNDHQPLGAEQTLQFNIPSTDLTPTM